MDKIDITLWRPRGLREEDYETLVEWWEAYSFPPPGKVVLPVATDGFSGLMMEDTRGKQYCAGFVYFTNSIVAWVEFIVSNPAVADKKMRRKMLRQLIQSLTHLAEDNGAKVLFTSLTNQNLKEHFLSQNWVMGDEGSTQLIKHV